MKKTIKLKIKGIKGEKGDTPSTDELVSIITPLIPEPIKGDIGERGEKGDRGADGKDGVDGYTPIKGVDYFDGAKGERGLRGFKGEDGKDVDENVINDIQAKVNRALDISSRDYDFKELKDVSITNPTNGQVPKYNSTTGKWENGNDTGSTSFITLTDTPASYSGQALKFPRVKATEDGLEFATVSVSTPSLQEVTDVGATTTNDISVPDEVYGAGWNGSMEVPTKNALYDKIETIVTSPAGSDTQVQFNDSGAFGGDANFTWNKTTKVLTLGASSLDARLVTHAIKSDASDGLLIEANNGTDVGLLGAGNTANVVWYGNHNYNTATASTLASFGASKTLQSASVGSTLSFSANTLGLNLANANTFTATQGVTKDSIGATSTDGITLINNTGATAGLKQWSPRLRFRGYGVESSAINKVSDFVIENQPSTGGASEALGQLVFSSAGTSGTYTPNLILESTGNLIPKGNIQMTSVRLQGGSGAGWGSLAFGAGGAGTQTLTISGFNDGLIFPDTLSFKKMQYTGNTSIFVQLNSTAGGNSTPSVLLRGSQGNDPGNPVARVWSGSTYASHRLFGVGHGTSYTEDFVVYSNGFVGIGTNITPSTWLHVIGTTEQLRIGYDASNRMSLTVGSTGGVTFDAVGSGAGFTFSDSVTVNGNLTLGTAGNKINITEGTNATVGVATLVAGTITVNTTAVTANSRIFLTRQTTSGTLGTSVDVTARTAGTSFTITSNGSILDTSDVAWLIIN